MTPIAPGVSRARVLRFVRHCLYPRNWPDVLRRIHRNREFFADLVEYAHAHHDARHQALKRLIDHLRRRALEGDMREWTDATKGYASDLLESDPWLLSQLKGTPHFGAIGLTPTNVTRLDYARLINHQLLKFKEEFAGYGLGSPACTLPSGRKLTGLELTQTWSLISNAGHLFGTFATERGLLYELFREPGLFERFCEGIDEGIREAATKVVEARRLIDFYYALAAWRLSRVEIGTAEREDLLAVWNQFLSERAQPEASVHMWAFRSARRLAYNQMHLYLGVGPPIDTVGSDETVRALSPWNELNYEPLMVRESSLLGTLLEASDVFQWEQHFAGSDVASDVLAHLRAFRAWWKTVRGDFPAAIDSLFGAKPPTWRDIDPTSLTHFARVKLPGPARGWLDEVEVWLRDESAWTKGNFLVAPRAIGGRSEDGASRPPGLLVDVYARTGEPVATELLCATAGRLAEHCEQSWGQAATPDSRELWRSIAVFGLRSFALLTVDSVRPLLKPAEIRAEQNEDVGRVGYAIVARPDAGLTHARRLAERFIDEVRQREFNATLVTAEETAARHEGAPLLILLGTTHLVDANNAQTQRAEFDGVWAFFAADGVHWYLLEHKKRRSPGHDLDGKLTFFAQQWDHYVPCAEGLQGQVAVATLAYGI